MYKILRKTRVSALAVAAIALCDHSSAWAIGLCEDTGASATLIAVSESHDQFIVKGELGWCVEDDDGVAIALPDGTTKRLARGRAGGVPYAEVLDKERRPIALFILARGEDRAYAQLVVDPDRLARAGDAAALTAYREKHGFVPVDRVDRSPTGACQVVDVADAETVTNDAGFSARHHTVEIRAGDAVIARARVQEVSGLGVQPMFLPKARVLYLWIEAVRCTGGPPPGYFGEDDPGDCYESSTVELREYRVETAAELAVCFAPPDTTATQPNLGKRGGCGACASQGATGAPGRPAWALGVLGLLCVVGRRAQRRRG